MVDKESPFANVDFPAVMDLRLASIYLNVSEGRIRTLLREGTIPSVKDDSGHWAVAKTELDKYQETKATTPRTGGAKGSGKTYLIKIPFAKMQAVKDALAKEGIELQPRYDYAKQKAYQAKTKAAKAAKKAAEKAVPAPAPAQAPSNPFAGKK
jgi:excisionase family DNA binding protein